VLQADTKDERDTQQRRKRRKQSSALDLRQQRRREPGVLAKVDEANLLLQAKRTNLGSNSIVVQSVLQGLREHGASGCLGFDCRSHFAPIVSRRSHDFASAG
jgi:hypothetical protein